MGIDEELQALASKGDAFLAGSFHPGFREFTVLSATSRFALAFPGARMVRDRAEVQAIRDASSSQLVPFMIAGGNAADVYAFEDPMPTQGVKVVVWSKHAVVHDWPSFSGFLDWIRTACHQAQ